MQTKQILLIAGVFAAGLVTSYLVLNAQGNTPRERVDSTIATLKTLPQLGQEVELTQENIDKENFPIKCEVNDEYFTGTLHFKNQMIRASGTLNQSENESERNPEFLIKDHTLWTWDRSTMQGMTMTVSEPNLSESEDFDFTNPELNKRCVVTHINDEVFATPTGIEFTSFEARMEEVTNQTEEAIRRGIQEAIEEAGPQYQNQ